jgi:hypothetical protein
MNLLTKAHPNTGVCVCGTVMATIFLVVENVATQETGYEWLKAHDMYLRTLPSHGNMSVHTFCTQKSLFVTSFKIEAHKI